MENKGKIKDLILTRLLEKRSDDYLFVSHIPALLENQITKEEAHLLIEEMFENPLMVAEIRHKVTGNTYLIRANSTTKKFLDNGGFAAVEENENQKKKRELIKANQEFKLSKWKYYTFWFVFAFGLFGGLYSAKDWLNSKEKENSIEQLKNLHKKDSIELKQLKSRVDSLIYLNRKKI